MPIADPHPIGSNVKLKENVSMVTYTPYTYLIGWSKLNWWYYGAEYGHVTKTANPSNLWTKYFTSSKEVAIVRDMYGEPDVIQIRHKFNNEESCKEWEQKVLKRMHVVDNNKWLNKTDHKTPLTIYLPSKDNHWSWKGDDIILKCANPVCNKEFSKRPYDPQIYCCHKCTIKFGENNPISKPKIKLMCLYCDNVFEVSKNRKNKAKYCSRKCKDSSQIGIIGKEHVSYKPRIKRKCLNPNCDNTFECKNISKKKYCSPKCSGGMQTVKMLDNSIELVCNHCHNPFLVPFRSKNRKYCTLKCANISKICTRSREKCQEN